MMTNREIKAFAWHQMHGNWIASIAAYLVMVIGIVSISFGISMVLALAGMMLRDPVILFGSSAYSTLLISTCAGICAAALVALLLWFIIGTSLGMEIMFLNIVRGRKCVPFDIFKSFRVRQMGHYLGVMIIIWLISWVLMMPELFLSLRMGFQTKTVEVINIITTLLIYYMALVLGMAPLASADNPDMKAGTAIRVSIHIMKKRKIRFLMLMLSFLPWILLSVITFGVGFLWTIPYMVAAQSIFYLSAYSEDYQGNGNDDVTPYAEYRELSPEEAEAVKTQEKDTPEKHASFEEIYQATHNGQGVDSNAQKVSPDESQRDLEPENYKEQTKLLNSSHDADTNQTT